ncbi:probable rhamnogalacturonate lyase B isoform X2 [Cryptomeria japonica]|uniref:probable rhamnogalacturonate lyase B isoform X2 n=1 Tax=Cryptomeria japonica TaxID=3369 RepID=UPI0025AD8736|nr:probable rhamnogalacturonate lyase B isoform X2 [Cryptomeria japonica]
MESGDVVLSIFDSHVVLDNGIVMVTLSKPGGCVTDIQYGGIINLMETLNLESHRGYWDLNWNEPGGPLQSDLIQGREFSVVVETPDQVEVSFVRNWDSVSSPPTDIPLNIDIRYILLRGSSGFYAYAIYQRPSGFPDCDLVQTRMVFRLSKDKFQYMAIADDKQRVMAIEDDRSPGRCQKLAYPEAVLLTNPINPALKGQVDDKYQYSLDNKDGGVHGWISFDPMVGFWIIFPSHEFRNGGPTKQNLTLHAGPICLAMFHSGHYIGDNSCKFRNGEAWMKVLGPFYVHLNSSSEFVDPFLLWNDAKQQRLYEEQSWPYYFPASPNFLKKEERCSISGRFLVDDRFISTQIFPADSAYIGLAAPGEAGSWQKESKGYQFWTKTDQNGYFQIVNINAGEYNIYGWVPNVVGDYKNEIALQLSPGSSTDLGDLIYKPPRNGPTLWEIGIADRTALEFNVPDPIPKFINSLYINHPEKFRQYGLWERYADLYPENDLVYTVGISDYTKDWFFAHVTREMMGHIKEQHGKSNFKLIH